MALKDQGDVVGLSQSVSVPDARRRGPTVGFYRVGCILILFFVAASAYVTGLKTSQGKGTTSRTFDDVLFVSPFVDSSGEEKRFVIATIETNKGKPNVTGFLTNPKLERATAIQIEDVWRDSNLSIDNTDMSLRVFVYADRVYLVFERYVADGAVIQIFDETGRVSIRDAASVALSIPEIEGKCMCGVKLKELTAEGMVLHVITARGPEYDVFLDPGSGAIVNVREVKSE